MIIKLKLCGMAQYSDADQYKDAEMVVFESDPVYKNNTKHAAVEGDHIAYSSRLKYKGKWVSVTEWMYIN